MNFLNPAVLFAMAAAALPLVIHLLSRRRAKDVAWPSIEFLDRMRTERMRRLRLKQLLLILVRTLIIVLIVMAFARPAVNSAFHRNARISAVIVVDSSASMSYVHNGEVVYNTAARKAGEILGMLGENDTAAVILSGDEPHVLGSGGLSADKGKISEILDEPN
ncbi:MAG: BatA domain-containing protein, partial [Candidatus Latescibacteria bacterium]|nr:BatA domain-containing protein [Candidatus Latescibacterota bacterium]